MNLDSDQPVAGFSFDFTSSMYLANRLNFCASVSAFVR